MMRNSIKNMISSVALAAVALSFGTAALAQSDVKPVNYDKTISGPNADGVYTINLEAYVTGSVTVTESVAPADIVLVLDYSGSMTNSFTGGNTSGTSQRIYALRNAVKDFVDKVKSSNADIASENRDGYGGHRIAFILYGGNGVFSNTGLSTLIKVEDLTTGNNSSSNAGSVTYNNTNLIGYSTKSGGTPSDKAMTAANTLLSEQDYVTTAPNRSRVVVFFTDGVPGTGAGDSWDNNRETVANACINAAHTIKNAENYSATIYSVGLFNAQTSANLTTTYLSYVSSDFKDKTALPSSSSDYVNVSDDKSIIVSNSSQLENIFSSIASASTPDATAASSSSVMVDIVASNFQIPENTDLGSVKVYQVACTQASAASIISFSGDKEDITNVVTLVTDKTNGEVSVTGFDYGANWCGWDGSANNNTGAAHGYKLVLEIPITVKDDVVGGPSVDTNAEGSQLIIKDANGEVVASYNFTSPVVRIPVAIWIQKEGLNNNDSAIFTLRKTKFLGRYETDENEDIITDDNGKPKRIDYTYVKGQTRSYTVKGVVTEMKWETFTKLAVNKKYNSDGIVKISGLDPDYVYRIEEDAWAHLGYDFDPDATARYTMEWDSATNSYKDVQNPFVFTNTSKGNVYAEDVIRNEFGQGSGTGGGLTTNE